MKLKQLAVLTGIAMLTFTVHAGDKGHKMKIEIASDEGAGETRLVLDSNELGFELHEMQVGENQSVVDSDGRPVLITRTEDGYSFDVDGKTIDMPDMMSLHEDNVWISDIDVDHEFAPHGEVDVRVIGHRGAPSAMAAPVFMGGDGIVVISGKKISEATQQAIRDALAADGHENVDFVGGHQGEEAHHVKVVRKIVETTER